MRSNRVGGSSLASVACSADEPWVSSYYEITQLRGLLQPIDKQAIKDQKQAQKRSKMSEKLR